MLPVVTVVIVSSGAVIPLARPAGAANTLTSAKAQAAKLEQEISSTGQQIDALDQKFEAAQANKASLDQQITVTQAKIGQTRKNVSTDRAKLSQAAVNAYMDTGSSAATNPIFSSSQTATADAREYDNVSEGNLTTAVDNLNTAQNGLSAQEASLHQQDAQAAQAEASVHAAVQAAQTLEAQQTQAFSQVKGQIATLIAQQQKAAAAAAEAAAQAKLAAAQAAAQAQAQAQVQTQAQTRSAGAAAAGPAPAARVADPPPPSAGGAGGAAVAAAESQIGVPYVWGAESPGSGFDCSGLVAWAWGQAGVPLPHYSGAQMSDSTPVPISDLQPGDLLFYGPGGSEHVAMYVGGGTMIEAPYTGASVWLTGLRISTGSFAGAGRP
jgi:cell wall-associated NlpC family hydrolase